QCRFVAFAASAYEHRPAKRRRHDLADLPGEPHDAIGDHAAEQMDRPVGALLDRADYGWVVVPDSGAHLPRREVEDLSPGDVRHVAAPGLDHDFREHVAAIADEIVARRALWKVVHLQEAPKGRMRGA